MPRAHVNGIELEYDVRGQGEPLVLVMGIGAQMVHWPEGFLDELVGRGFQVIRFDNRDCGLSSQLDHLGVPAWRAALARALVGLPVEGPYTLVDMADDLVGLLDELGIERAHVVGASLGGMIAHCTAIAHPNRLRTLTSIMSHTGARRPDVTTARGLRALLQPPATSPEQAGDKDLAFLKVCGSTKFAHDEADVRRRARLQFERGVRPRGFMRQLTAMAATPDRTPALRWVRAPTLVIHGTDDTLLRPLGGKLTARAVPNSRLRMIDGMGHDLPPGVWPIVGREIAAHAAR